MSRMRMFLYSFWIFVGVMILWQCANYNATLNHEDPAHPSGKQFFFIHTNSSANVVAPPKEHDGPYVRQIEYVVLTDTPAPGSFTCKVTVKNVGHAKATQVQVKVRPFRGAILGDEDIGRSSTVIDDNDPRSQLNAWVSFPDLAPGETSVGTAVFVQAPGVKPGVNRDPEIIFEEAKPASSSPGSPPTSPANLPARPAVPGQ